MPQDVRHERRDLGLAPEVHDRGEEGLEVEDDGGGEGKAAESLPVDAEVDALCVRERERG